MPVKEKKRPAVDAGARVGGPVYLDHSATTPVDPEVADLVHRVMLEGWGNPSSKYKPGNAAKIVLERSRERVANLLGAPKEDVFFTSGGTESDNLAIFGVMEAARDAGRGDHFITDAIEHSAVLHTVDALREDGFRVTVLPVTAGGFVEPDALRDAIDDRTVLASVMHVNNEIGTIEPIRELAAVAHERGVLFHTDAVQSFGKEALDVRESEVDLVSVSSHKIYGPKGVGALYIRHGVEIRPRQFGGGQERGIRTGTENMPGIAGFGAAAELCGERMDADRERIGALCDRFLGWIRDECGGDVLVNGSRENRIYLNLNLRFPDVEGESLLLALDLDGIAVSTGSACSSGSTEPSHVLLALGLSEQEAHSSIRLTLGRGNDEVGLRYAAECIGRHVRRLREMAAW
ncbi:MAG: Cysteine desulfurase IscS [Calditrichaeota bacterium]|nr:Cysteine desulfurase IscS [Calditrichota bacterium]